jgi:ADP-ribosyl-[dinitrogen reductase] hydrolase
MGDIGVTFCPGKKDRAAMTGAWDRDLDADLDAIAQWGASAVVTLLEPAEFALLSVPRLGCEVRRRHMSWLHLPIPDAQPPDDAFEAGWERSGEAIRTLLQSGFSAVFHCRGGLGRAGTVASRALVELGWDPKRAIDAVRAVRPGAIETPAQEAHVLGQRALLQATPDTSLSAVRDRARGALLGLACGDAVGTTVEFRERDTFEPVTDMVGAGPFNLPAGAFTDDMSMAWALADSLALTGGLLDPDDLMDRFVAWYREGRYSSIGTCFDIGITTMGALEQFMRTGDPLAGPTSERSAGNGSLMRLAPAAIAHWRDPAAARSTAVLQSRTTHGAPQAVDACAQMAELLTRLIAGAPPSEVLSPAPGLALHPEIAAIFAGSWRGRPRHTISSSGYVVHTLEAALWCTASSTSFEDAVLKAANLGNDADTVGAVTGQIAGAIYGESGIPERWLARLYEADTFRRLTDELGGFGAHA